MVVLPIAAKNFKHPFLQCYHLSPHHWESLLEELSGIPLMQLTQYWQQALLEHHVVTFFLKKGKSSTRPSLRFSLQQNLPLQVQSSSSPDPWAFSELLSFQTSYLSGISRESSYLPSKALGKATLPVSNYN